MSLFPHQKLDWSIQRLDRQLYDDPSDDDLRLQYGTALWSRGHFQGSAESDLVEALAQVEQVLRSRPDDADALVVCAMCQIGLDRLEEARKHLTAAREHDEERAPLHHAWGLWHRARARRRDDAATSLDEAVAALGRACLLRPDAWEVHALHATLLWEWVQRRGGPARVERDRTRPVARSMYHAVLALQLTPPPVQVAPLLYHLGVTCFHTHRPEDANRVLSRLLQDDTYKGPAEYYLGLVHYQLGHFKNAVLYLRQHLRHTPGTARVYARIGMAYLRMGELAKAQDACEQALALDSRDLQSRWTLGCALLESGEEAEALREFRALLADAPDHTPAFRELARAHARRGDGQWLHSALRTEVAAFDQVDVKGFTSTGVTPRQATWERIEALTDGMIEASGTQALSALLEALDTTEDEGLRMALWEAALRALQADRAADVARKLRAPGRHYSAALGRQVLALATSIPDTALMEGMQLGAEDLRRAAVERHGHRDVEKHRRAIDHEHREARAWQALLLLSLATQRDAAHLPVLTQWAEQADRDLGDAARAGLVLLGDEDAAEELRRRAYRLGAQHLVDAMVAQVKARQIRTPVEVTDESRVCATCGKHTEDVDVMLLGGTMCLCSDCIRDIDRDRGTLWVDDPDRTCQFSGRDAYQSDEMYLYKGVSVCAEVIDHGLTMIEQRAVDRFLRSQT